MRMETKNDKNRVGIYTQVSAEATAAGEGLAPQGEKSPVATGKNNENGNEKMNTNTNANQSQCSDNVSQSQATKSQDNTDEDQSASAQDNPFRKEFDLSTAGSQHSGDGDGGDEKLSRDNKYRLSRIVNMQIEFKKLLFTNSEVKAMETALEDERKKRHNSNKMARYCQENNMDEVAAREKMLARKERELAKYKAEKAARALAFAEKGIIPNFKRNRGYISRTDEPQASRPQTERGRRSNIACDYERDVRLNQTWSKIQRDPYVGFVSPAILAGANPSMKKIHASDEQPGPSGRNRSRSPLNRFGRDAELEEANRRMGNRKWLHLSPPSSDSSDIDSTEKSLSAFCVINNLTKLSKKERHKLSKGKLPPSLNPYNLKYPIEVQIVNRAHPFGAISEEDQQLLLLKGLQNSVQEERDNGANWVKIGECSFKKKILHVRCRNRDTVDCLEQKIPFFNRLLLGADLYLARDKVSFTYKKMRAILTNYNVTTEEFFKIIKKQNGFPTETWQEFHRRYDGTSVNLLFGVDPESYEQLQRDNGFVYFFMGRLLLKFDKK